MKLLLGVLVLYLLWRGLSYALVYASIRLRTHERAMADAAQAWASGHAEPGVAYRLGWSDGAAKRIAVIHYLASKLTRRGRHSLADQWNREVRVNA